MRRRRASDSHEGSHGIDLAPMLDFVINLLIFFIITAVFVKESGLVVNRPTSFEQQQTSEESKDVQIEISETGDITVDHRETDVRAVRANVERKRSLHADAGALIIASTGAPTGRLIEVVDQVHLGGIYNITFSTRQD
jgi:biopolymer transport protein ExbD